MEHADTPVGPARKTGRPLSFDRDAALEKAMHAFWRYGYETTSIAALTAAMGITPPSLYTAFGDKRQLFLEAVKLYAGDPEARARVIAEAPSAYVAARDMLNGAAQAFADTATPPGCLLASATASGSEASEDVQRAVADVRRDIASMLCKRIEHDMQIGKLPQRTDATALAGLVIAVIQGMSVLARDGANCATLLAIAHTALDAWPRQAGSPDFRCGPE